MAEDLSLLEVYKLVNVRSSGAAARSAPWARVTMAIEGVESAHEATGGGPVEAVMEAIKSLVAKPQLALKDYELSAVSGGRLPAGKGELTVQEDGLESRGQGRHTDVVLASALALVERPQSAGLSKAVVCPEVRSSWVQQKRVRTHE